MTERSNSTRKDMRGRQKTRWNDSCKRDMECVGLIEKDVDGVYWTGQSGCIVFITIPATPDDGNSPGRSAARI